MLAGKTFTCRSRSLFPPIAQLLTIYKRLELLSCSSNTHKAQMTTNPPLAC